MLYQPSHSEIDAVISRGIAKQPKLTSRFLRASVILATGALTYGGNSWQCDSQSHPDEKAHTVDFHGCSCLDCFSEGAKVGGAPFCKHKLALLALNEIAGAQIAARCVGTYNGCADFAHLRRAVNAGLLIINFPHNRPAVATVADPRDHIPTCVCNTRWTLRGQRPADEAELAKLLTWLDDALKLPPVIEAEMLFRRGLADGLPEADAAALADELLIARYAAVDDAALADELLIARYAPVDA